MAEEHNHLDQQRRDRGVCPACDELWEAQNERTASMGSRQRAERSLDTLVNRESKLGEERYGKRGRRGD